MERKQKNEVQKEKETTEPVREIDEAMLAEALKETSVGTAGAVQVEYLAI